jgi:hypothetical protein
MTWFEFLSLVFAALGLIGGGVGFFRSNAAEAKADAATQIATQARIDLADATKDIAANFAKLASGPKPQVEWKIIDVAQDMYQLLNVGNVEAHGIGISSAGDGSVRNVRMDALMNPDLKPGQYVGFDAVEAAPGIPGHFISVVWSDETSPQPRDEKVDLPFRGFS